MSTWDERSNIKAKPGSQGTLFQVANKDAALDPHRRWPKKYTPERQREVNEALGYHNTGEYYVSDNAGTGRARRAVNETIKRSTVPAEDVKDLRITPGQLSLVGGKANGVYYQKEPGRPKATIGIKEGHEDNYVSIHEIGHHVSATKGTPHSAYLTPEHRGQEEAYADKYAHEHFRDRRGERQQGLRWYPGDMDRADTAQFNMSYSRHRGNDIPDDLPSFKRTPQQQQFVDAKDAESKGESLFTTWDNGDGRVGFHAPSDKSYQIGEEIGWTPKGKKH